MSWYMTSKNKVTFMYWKKAVIVGGMFFTALWLTSCVSVKGHDYKRNGVYNEYYESGNVHYERHFVNGKKHDLSREFDEDGNIKCEVTYVNGKRHGPSKVYYPNGNVKKTFTYQNGKVNGLVSSYLENGKLWHENIFKDGQPTSMGVRKYEYHDNGNLKREYGWDDGDAYEKQYYKNGQVLLETQSHYDSTGIGTGYLKEYYLNGQIAFECHFVNLKATDCKEYSENGELSYSGECLDEGIKERFEARKTQLKREEILPLGGTDPDGCIVRWNDDIKWCDQNFNHRLRVVCLAWAQEEVYRCTDTKE